MSMSIKNTPGYTTPMRPKCILLNGPPLCGKDTIGAMIGEMRINAVLRKFAQPLIDGMQAMFGVSCADGMPKGDPCQELFGKARRPVAISLAEDWIKKQFGDEAFGKILMDRIMTHDMDKCVIVTDSGFAGEANVLLKHFNPGEVEIVKIVRPGHNFDDDSRSYWSDPRAKQRKILNDGTLTELQAQVRALIDTKWTR